MTRLRRHTFFVLRTWLLYRATLIVVMYFARGEFPPNFRILGKGFLHSFTSWDGEHYHQIVKNGYNHPPLSNVAFFPSYPVAVRWLTALIPDDFLAGVVLSNVLFVIALFFLYAWALDALGEQAAQRAIRYALVMPGTHFFSCYYTESMFLLAVCGAFYAYQTRKPWLYVPFGFLAGCTRAPGMLLLGATLLGELVRFVRFPAERKRILLWSPAWLSPAAGLGSYMFYLHKEFNEPFAYSKAMAAWGRRFDFPWGSIQQEFLYPLEAYRRFEAYGAIILLGLALYALWKLPIAYGSFFSLSTLMATSTHMTASVIRYNVGTGVVFLLFAMFGKRAERTLLPILAMFAAFSAACYAAGYWSG